MTTQAQLDDRYGRTARPRAVLAFWIAVALVAIGGTVWLGWSTVSRTLHAVGVDDLGYTVRDEHTVEVSFQLSAPPGRDIACALEALDAEFGVVGWRIVEYGADGRHARSHTETIPTVAQATTGLVNSCWVT
ncbi:DUF4307 domain-containing protein [Microbacterium album]|uniref:Uncharacterized protein n=1 Tax=Microbacterium album TaxID=2053191 RepID=A0A917ICI2_9MICO|nr:DUF4307 domain-containing protein [Microbacterium album]GGH38432.1 hypothetical protein GCM10010921_08990 [Microbacterium album]